MVPTAITRDGAAMDPVSALRGLGGSARWSALDGHVSRSALAAAVRGGSVVHQGRTYALPDAGRDLVLAHELTALRSHTTAAAHHGFALPPGGQQVHLTIGRKAQRSAVPGDVRLHYRDHECCDDGCRVTSPLCTVLDCLRDEPLRVALSVGDSALAARAVRKDVLLAHTSRLRGPYARMVHTRARLLDARAANAFESSCRAILIAAGITGFRPQVDIRYRGRWVARVDLADTGLRIIVECDGFETHGGRRAFVDDLIRHTTLVAAGWRTLRFTWEQVMFYPEWVLEMVQATIAVASTGRAISR